MVDNTYLNLYLVTRKDHIGYDEYISFVVCCENTWDARKTHPENELFKFDTIGMTWYQERKDGDDKSVLKIGSSKTDRHGWIYGKDIDDLDVQHIGIATKNMKRGIVESSFNSG